MDYPIAEEASKLTLAINDMTNNPWQADAATMSNYGTPAQAYNAQRNFWMRVLGDQEPASLPIFIENYLPRTDVMPAAKQTFDIPPGHALINGKIVQLPTFHQEAPPAELTKRQDILRTAESLIHGDREQDYGRPIDSFRRVAAAFNLVLEGAGHPPIDPVTAAKLMIALKLSRLAGGDNKDDTWIDLAGYSALGAEVRDQQ